MIDIKDQMLDGMARHYLKMGFTTQPKVDHLRGALAGKHNYKGFGYKNGRKEMLNFKMKNTWTHEEIEKLIGRMREILIAFNKSRSK